MSSSIYGIGIPNWWWNSQLISLYIEDSKLFARLYVPHELFEHLLLNHSVDADWYWLSND